MKKEARKILAPANIILFAVCLVSLSVESSFDALPRIYGGAERHIESAPYQVYLDNTYLQLVCGGSIIGAEWILTAAHCIMDSSDSPYQAQQIQVYIGNSNGRFSGSMVSVKRFIHHPSRTISEYDFGLLQLYEPLTFSDKVKPIALPNENERIADGTKCLASGWGETDDPTLNGYLLGVQLPIVNQDVCAQVMNPHLGEYEITPRMICAGYESGGKGTCRGDSGGPLVCNGKLFGVTSFGLEDCATPNAFSIFGRVSIVRSWIKRETGI